MEAKVCTYTEKGIRLQLVKIQEPGTQILSYEIRLNRQVIFRTSISECHKFGTFARLMFMHYVQEICVNRRSDMSFMTL